MVDKIGTPWLMQSSSKAVLDGSTGRAGINLASRSKESLNKSILDFSAPVTEKRGFPVTYKINRLGDRFSCHTSMYGSLRARRVQIGFPADLWRRIPASQELLNKSAVP